MGALCGSSRWHGIPHALSLSLPAPRARALAPADGKPIGAVAVANRPSGYTEEVALQLGPFNQVVADIMGGYLQLHRMPEEAPVEVHGAPAQVRGGGGGGGVRGTRRGRDKQRQAQKGSGCLLRGSPSAPDAVQGSTASIGCMVLCLPQSCF